MIEIILATANEGKIREFTDMFASLPVHLTSLKDRWDPLPEIEETGESFYDNSKIKADRVFEESGGVWTLADDSGLEVDVLGGAPGVRSARFAGSNAHSAENNRKLLVMLRDVPPERRTARFRCVLVLKTEPDKYLSTQGVCEGKIALCESGTNGFGYDPLFIPEGYDSTFAVIGPAEKNGISHRAKALRQLKEELHEFFKV